MIEQKCVTVHYAIGKNDTRTHSLTGRDDHICIQFQMFNRCLSLLQGTFMKFVFEHRALDDYHCYLYPDGTLKQLEPLKFL